MASAQLVSCPKLPNNPKEDDYRHFKRLLNNYFNIADTPKEKRVYVLQSSLGRDGLDIYDGLPDPKSSYDEAMKGLDNCFTGKSSVLLRRKNFYNCKQASSETIGEFACRLRRVARDCNFGNSLTETLRDIFVLGVYDNNLGEKLLSEDDTTLTFDLAVKRAEAHERARCDRHNLKPTSTAVAVNPLSSNSNSTSTIACYRCGSKSHKANNATCPAKSASCRLCGKVGHFQKTCRSANLQQQNNFPGKSPITTSSRDSRVANSTSKCQTNAVEQDSVVLDNSNTDYSLFTVESEKCSLMRDVMLHSRSIQALVDTGAQRNVLPLKLVPPGVLLNPSEANLYAFGGSRISVVGELEETVTYGSHTTIANFVVADVSTSYALLSASLCKSLHILHELCNTLSTDNHDTSSVTTIVETYKRNGLFRGLGEVLNYQCEISVDSTVKPVSCGPRRLPPAIVPQVEDKISELVNTGVIRKISEPTAWCSGLVVARKPNGSIRLCVDLRKLNEAVQRPVFQIPNTEDISAAPSGRYCWTRLPYGIKSAPEIFQDIMSNLLKDVPCTHVFFDDILIATKDTAEHEQVLLRIFKILHENGMTLNLDKCIFNKSSVNFLGHCLSSNGVSPSPAKVNAVANMELPSTREQLRSFLGLATYVGQRFISYYSSLVAPLWDMLKPNSIFEWTSSSTNSFKSLCSSIAGVSSLSWFSPSLPSTIYTDASGLGIGCCLMQEGKPVAYASRRLTAVEQRYSTLEKEFLAIVYALGRFRRLILFTTGTVVNTDHKPILGLFAKNIDSLPMRIQRWIMAIQGYDINIQYVKGSSNCLADALSRNFSSPIPSQNDITPEENSEHTVCFVAKSLPIDLRAVATATQQDRELRELREAIENDWPAHCRKLNPYYSFRDELTVKESEDKFIIFRCDRAILPQSLVQSFLSQLHEGHIGIAKMKDIVRSTVYWPNFSDDVERFVKRCSSCAIFNSGEHRPPVTPIAHEIVRPMQQIAVDITGPSEVTENKFWLTIIDLHSRYPEVYIMQRSTTTEIIKYLRKFFSLFGYPEILQTDNGSQFVSEEFESFLSNMGIKHSMSANYHPQSNGCVERLHRTLKSRLVRILHPDNVSLQTALDQVLLDIRTTPHAMTGFSPAKVFLGREMRSKLSLIVDSPITGPKRNAAKEYSNLSSTSCPQFRPGEMVFYRKGLGNPFQYEGEIVESAGIHSYRIRDESGRVKVYNMRDLKRRFSDQPTYLDLQLADEAYDAVTLPTALTPEPISTHRYPLRRKPIDPIRYKT